MRSVQHPSHRSFLVRLSRGLGKLVSSRKTRHKPSLTTSCKSHLPMEVWGVVIKHACLAYHDPLDTVHDVSFLEETSTLLATYQAAMRDKLALSLVSSQWYAYAKEYLFEFVWISSASQAKALAHVLLIRSLLDDQSFGSYIRRLHIETAVHERCAPADLRTILDNAPNLCIYSDNRSIRRSLYDDGTDPRCTSAAILKLIAHPQIRRLSWTSYGDAPFQQPMAPLWMNLADKLEYLEISQYASNSRAPRSTPTDSGPHGVTFSFTLPRLRALKVSLDDDTFAALSSWDMPQLRNLSVLSPDFTQTGPGFASFFRAHGSKLLQLELGHSSSLIEEHYLTAPPGARAHLSQQPQARRRVPLATWCPNLREFICSADAEWHWQSPDWIPAHVLLPAHPTIELIGIRNIDVRFREDPDISGEPFFTLYEQLSSLLKPDAFPNLRFVRDLSRASDAMRCHKPSGRVLQFWQRVVAQCSSRCVWLEDCTGINVTKRSLLRAAQAAQTNEVYGY